MAGDATGNCRTAQHQLRKLGKQYTDAQPEYSYFKVNGRMVKIMHADIICAQSIKDYIIIRTQDANYITHMTMKYLADLLSGRLALTISAPLAEMSLSSEI